MTDAGPRLVARLFVALVPAVIGWLVIGPEWAVDIGTLACTFQVLAEVVNDG